MRGPASAAPPSSPALGYQAVALAITAGTDRTCLEHLLIDGHQDTLLTDAGRTSLERCLIRGHIDFIFGAGTAWCNPEAVRQAIFLRCFMDDHIDTAGWDRMSYGTGEGGRAWLEPNEARFRECRSRGPGAATNDNRPMLTAIEARQFNRDTVLAGWQPDYD